MLVGMSLEHHIDKSNGVGHTIHGCPRRVFAAGVQQAWSLIRGAVDIYG